MRSYIHIHSFVATGNASTWCVARLRVLCFKSRTPSSRSEVPQVFAEQRVKRSRAMRLVGIPWRDRTWDLKFFSKQKFNFESVFQFLRRKFFQKMKISNFGSISASKIHSQKKEIHRDSNPRKKCSAAEALPRWLPWAKMATVRSLRSKCIGTPFLLFKYF